ncbi:dihydropteroate synthase [Desulfobulbus alkaliphilus]|uniref:dihydropteroate synthase n=1 Tax=Desulfobulbus alkaliphilus TaxID=869814 RepID=UPI0019623024|nr:dihydropteroate synthase [Desulfobulbus alkaliphilus]MBM9537197.1 dihydropteroate synthase [Desulfobulbus alkaliphilus]
MKPSVASLYQAVELQQEIPPLLIGERANANGSKRFRELLLADEYEACLKIALEQEARGAHVIDLCTAYAGRDEQLDMTTLVRMCARSLKAPLMIDSTSPECIEACLKLYPGRAIINSVNLEDGGINIRRVCRVVRKYGAAVVALTIDAQGMAMTSEDKLRIARAIHTIAVDECGLRSQDLLFDCLTFTVGSGDPSLSDAAVQTLEGIRRIKAELPGCMTVLGLSNISFGLAPQARRILNSVFLHEAVAAGLDAAIVDVAKILPLAGIAAEDRQISLDLLTDQRVAGEKDPLMRFIEHFSGKTPGGGEDKAEGYRSPEELLVEKVLQGDKENLDDVLAILRQRNQPVNIINRILVPAMRHVGELFGKGEILLPFVLQSAEVMKASVTLLEPFMDKTDSDTATKILLATVQGDVHDIGKNLVDIILTNNGYTVYNIGIKVPAETVIEKAKEYRVDIIGLSGLLVKSALAMQDSMHQYRDAGLTIPILLGGAALTPKFVAESCVPSYPGPVVYCADAFAGLQAVKDFEAGVLAATVYDAHSAIKPMKPGRKESVVDFNGPVPVPPFIGQRYVEDINPAELFPLINTQALFRGRWGYRRGKMGAGEYEDLIQGTVQPLYEDLLRRSLAQGWIQAKVSYGYFPCYAKSDTLVVEAEGNSHTFSFPRQAEAPFLCIADYFRSEQAGGDLVGFFIVTIGSQIGEETGRLYQANAYHEYLLLHGFSVEVTDALAEYWHGVMRRELGIENKGAEHGQGYLIQEYQGSRYGFGYPACPDLEAHRPLFAFLKPEKLGISLTENMQMVPEQSTSAIVVHHPQAKYFAV